MSNLTKSKKHQRGDKGEDLVSLALTSLPIYSHIINNFCYVNPKSDMTHQLDHVFISENGIFVVETKSFYGEISLDKFGNFIRRDKKSSNRVGNPIAQNKSHTLLVNRLLGKKYDVTSVIVFVNNNAPKVEGENVINIVDLDSFILNHKTQRKLSNEEVDNLFIHLLSFMSEVDEDEHVTNIDFLKKVRKEEKKEKIFAIETRTCPRCGGAIKEKSAIELICSKCGFRIKL